MFLNIEITNRCRLECSKCARTYFKNQFTIADLSLENFQKILDSKKFKVIFFGGTYGDCIYHPNFYDIIKLSKQYGISVTINTNGSGKSIQWWENIFELLDSEDELLIAMDGFEHTSGIYRKNFTNKDFSKNINILSLAANKYKIKASWMFIPFSFNEDQIKQAATLAIENNIKFIVKKSNRWNKLDDPLLPKNLKLISNASSLLNVP